MKTRIKNIALRIKSWLGKLSFRTGVVLIVICAMCYIISFAQMLLPISAAAKGVLWVVFFGLAKTFQYSALAVLGTAGIKRVKDWWKNRRSNHNQANK
jgi:phosphoglycolate phosphatase